MEGTLEATESASWPAESGPFVVLVDASSALERDLIRSWIESATVDVDEPIDILSLPPSRRRRPFGSVDPAIGERLVQEDDPLCIPVRVAWLAEELDGVRRVRLSDLLKPGDPRDPNFLRQRLILNVHPDRCRIVVGEPGRRSDLEKRWSVPTGRGPADGTTLGEFVALQAWMALERAERQVRGMQYKVPKFLKEDLFWSRPFQSGLQRIARDEGKPESRLRRRAERYLREIAAQHSPYVIDLFNGITTKVIEAAHQDIDYSASDLRGVYAFADENPIVFLPSHKSNFDHLVFQHVLYENGLPLNHTAGGTNMNFFLIGPLLRRSGIFFIRREFKKNEAYKFVLKQYIDYLLEKRFALEWYIEGGRSRSGKLREPKLGLLSYVADSYQRGITDDVILVPVSINYDQITDVGSYAAEQSGGKKEAESFAWALRFLGSLRRQNGRIYIRFGKPLALSSHLERDRDLSTPGGQLALPKIAFEISTRINEVTPMTAISMVTLALLSDESHGHTIQEVARRIEPFMSFVEERGLPTTDDLPFSSHDEITAALDALVLGGVVARVEGLTESVYSIAPGKHLSAAYYRNTIIHFFVNAGITELALASCDSRDTALTIDSVVNRALEIRDLLKFEFFFSPRDEFATEIRFELGTFAQGRDTGEYLTVPDRGFLPKSPTVLRPFLEAYYVMASALAASGAEALDASELASRALAMGNQLAAHGDILSQEAVSTALFATGVKLIEGRGLLEGNLAGREALRSELREVLDTLDAVGAWESS